MKPLRWILLSVAALLFAFAGALWWLLESRTGAQWATGVVSDALDGKLRVREVRGTLSGPLEMLGVRYRDPKSGLDVQIGKAMLDVALRELFAWRLHIKSASAGGVMVRLGQPREEEDRELFSLEPPIDIVIDSFRLHGADFEREKKLLLGVRHADLAGHWTEAGIGIRRLEVDSPQGTVSLAGELGAGETYTGRAAGQFNWRVGELTYAGTLQAVGAKRQVVLDTALTAPFAARLHATLEQRRTLPWRFELRVPQFDPRDRVMPKSSIRSLAADLRGAGDRALAELRGAVAVNGERVRIEPLRVRMQERTVKLEALTLIDPSDKGRLEATGEVRLDEKPFFADLAVRWSEVSLPKEWVGQALVSRGDLQLRGNPSSFEAAGDLVLGPPRRPANITLALSGTPRAIELQRLLIEQSAGRANASGRVELKPAIGWQIDAQATRFDPGVFIAGWPGRLDFTIGSQGRITPQGPDARFDMTRLQGRLRGRPVSGQASLTLNPNKVVAGTLRVRSGGSAVRLTGERGDILNVVAEFDVATLDDWLPQSKGRANGRFHITGRWPQLEIAGSSQGRALAIAESTIDAVDVRVDLENPLHPAGSLTVNASRIRTGKFAFETVVLEASGSERNHIVTFVAVGEPLGSELRLTGSREPGGWSGTIEQLSLSAAGIAQLALRQPAQVALGARRFSISESCLAGDGISVCVAARQDETRNLQASYVLEHLPIALLATIAKPDLPYWLAGTLEGRGEIRRTPDGAWFGEAHIASPSGGIRADEEGSETLLSYENFKLDAALAGDSARVSTNAVLVALAEAAPRGAAGTGRLNGEVTLARLRSPAPTLAGRAELTIDDLAPLALLTPQLVDVAGRGEAHVTFAGTVVEPRIAGSARVHELAAELPKVGVQLRDGELEASMQAGGDITLKGSVASGDGQLAFDGGTDADGVLRVKVNGRNFLAANIPAAHVIVTPDLEFTRTSERMHLGGKVTVPQAKIDLTKLPENRVRRPSADVVVIDEEIADRSRRTPLHADVTVVLGEKVTLVGFGLDAKLEGELVVHEIPGQPTVGSGEIRVAGTYKAYGQDLTIEQGRLLFAGTPLGNPQVGLVAVRTLPEVVIKLNVSGSARAPLLAVSSEPAMPPTQALSYLVTGKPLNELGSGEGDVVQSAARSLGGAAGNLLAKGLGRRIGVDEIGIENSAEIGGSAFTVGEYLSPRLYLSYGVGLFEPGQVITLRYRISDKVSLEASQGPLNQRAGITYRIEK